MLLCAFWFIIIIMRLKFIRFVFGLDNMLLVFALKYTFYISNDRIDYAPLLGKAISQTSLPWYLCLHGRAFNQILLYYMLHKCSFLSIFIVILNSFIQYNIAICHNWFDLIYFFFELCSHFSYSFFGHCIQNSNSALYNWHRICDTLIFYLLVTLRAFSQALSLYQMRGTFLIIFNFSHLVQHLF